MRPSISIVITSPYVSVKEYSRISGINEGTVAQMVKDGRLPIRPKGIKKQSLTQINLAKLTVEALSDCNIQIA